MFSFGDSLIDTGNFIHYSKAPGSVSRPPYGRTFFGRPTGRWSDGRLIVDFIGTYSSCLITSLACMHAGVHMAQINEHAHVRKSRG
jgi:hypothetical protein